MKKEILSEEEKNIIINIDKLIGHLEINNSDYINNSEKIKKIIDETLLNAVRSAKLNKIK